jgi:hypothetical protein
MTCQCCSPTVDNEPVAPPPQEAQASGGGCGPECGCGTGTSAAAGTASHLAEIRRKLNALEPVG